jgi:hypothetical protein
MDERDKQRQDQEQPASKPPGPTAGEFFQTWQKGGKAKLKKTLPDEPDDEESSKSSLAQQQGLPTSADFINAARERGLEGIKALLENMPPETEEDEG